MKRATKKMRKNSVLGIKNHRSAAVRGGARRVHPPGSASEYGIDFTILFLQSFKELMLNWLQTLYRRFSICPIHKHKLESRDWYICTFFWQFVRNDIRQPNMRYWYITNNKLRAWLILYKQQTFCISLHYKKLLFLLMRF